MEIVTDSINNIEIINQLENGFTSLNFSFTPKIIWKQEEDDNYFFQTMPKYSIARVEAIGNYYEVNENENSIVVVERQVLKSVKPIFRDWNWYLF